MTPLNSIKKVWPKYITGFFFIILLGAYANIFAIGSPYQPGSTLDPSCTPGETNCIVQIIPSQTSNANKYLTTDGTSTSWSSSTLVLGGNFTTSGAYATTLTTTGTTTLTLPTTGTLATTSNINTAVSGTTNYIPKFTGTNTIGNSVIYDDGTNVGIGIATPSSKLQVSGDIRITSGSGGALIFADGTSINTSSIPGSAGSLANISDAIITGDSDANASGDVILKTGSNDRLHILNGGNVGIGTATPSDIFHVEKNQNASTAIYFSNTTAGTASRTRVIIQSDVSAGSLSLGMHSSTHSSTPNEAWVWGSGASTPLILGTVGAERMRIDTTGNVGIGTASPRAKTEIMADQNTFATAFTSPHLKLGASVATNDTGYTGIAYAISSNDNYGWTTGALRGVDGNNSSFVFKRHNNSAEGVEYMRIDTSGNLGVGTTSPFGQLHVNSATNDIVTRFTNTFTGTTATDGTMIEVGSSGHTYLWNYESANMYFGVNNASAMTILSSGNVGIGTATPQSKLQILGTTGDASGTAGTSAMLSMQSGSGTDLVFGSMVGSPFTSWIQHRHATNNNEYFAMALNPLGGNVGIGTTSPSAKLDIVGNIKLGTTLDSTSRYIGKSLNSSSDVGGNQGSIGFISTASDDYLTFATHKSGVSQGERMRIDALGNVGIGTTAPTQLLQVGGNAGAIAIGDGLTSNGTSRLKFTSSNTVTNWQISNNDSTSGAFEIMPSTVAGGTTFTTPSFIISSSGNVGVGNTGPTYKLDITAASSGSKAFRATCASGCGSSALYGYVDSGGSGISNSDPYTGGSLVYMSGTSIVVYSGATAATYVSGGNFGVNALAAGTANSLCYNTATLGGFYTLATCSSDARLKQNVTPLDGPTALAGINALNTVSFNWDSSFSSDQTLQFGLLAQEVAQVFPNLVSRTAPTPLTPDGTYSINFNGLYAPIIKSIQEMDIKVQDISSLDTTSATSLGSLIKQFLADSTNGIGDFFANRVRTKEICVAKSDGSEFCATGDQLEAIVGNSGSSNPAPNPTPEPSPEPSSDTTAPVITLVGDVTITLSINDTYTEQGAEALDNIDGSITPVITGTVDTATVGTYTITYTATDLSNNISTTTRTVNVTEPAL